MKKLFGFLLAPMLLLMPCPSRSQDEYEDYPEDAAYAEDYAAEDYAAEDYAEEGYEQPPNAAAPAAPVAPAVVAPVAPVAPALPAEPPQEAYIPLFSQTKPLYTADPANPRLPENHPLLRLKGSIWRSREMVLVTNKGVVSGQRLYLVFAKERDAAAFTLAPFGAASVTSSPRADEFISLTPLLETNVYRPSPYAGRYVEIPEKYRRPTTSALTGLIPEKVSDTFDDSLLQGQAIDRGLDTPPMEIVPEEIPAEDAYPEDAYPEGAYPEEYMEEYTEEDAFAALSRRPLAVVLQAVGELAVVNIGGMDGGIFIQENPGSVAPYTVLFLALEKDGSLSAYMIQNSFDIRSDQPEIVQARALYKKAFESRANMKRFFRVETPQEAISPSVINFFK